MMKQFIIQLTVILGLSLVIGLVYNHFSKTPLPLFKQYDPHMVDLVIAGKSDKAANPPTGEIPVPSFQEIDAETLQALVEAGKAMLLDARAADNFQQGHIPGAVNLPITRFKEVYDRLSPLPVQDKIIICYCEGHDCTDSTMLALELFKKGHKDLFVYKGGMNEWRELAYPLEPAEHTNDREN